MAQKTKEQLKSLLVDGHLVTGADCTDLIESLKGLQSPVSDPSASGTSTTFIATITQDAEGKIVVTKKTVNFSGYLPNTALNNMQDYDLQQVGAVTAAAGESQSITHKMKHYPTVRLIDGGGIEVKATEYTVTHVDTNTLVIALGASLTGSYRYILD